MAVQPYTGKAGHLPVLHRALKQAQNLHQYGNDNHPSEPSKFWRIMNDGLRQSAAFRAILAVAAELDYPQNWPCDLDIDRQCILKDGDARPFYWGIRYNGTAYVRLDDSNRVSKLYALEHFQAEIHTFPDLQWYYWDGKKLERVENVKAVEDTLREWAFAQPAEVR